MYESRHPITFYFYPLLGTTLASSPHAGDFERVLASPPVLPRSLLYIHVPYCHDLCRFCPFHVRVTTGDEVYARYAQALCREMELVAGLPSMSGRVFDAVYFGGGSPSILPIDDLRRIFVAMNRNFKIAPGAELSFEGEPRTLSDEARLDLLKEFGFHRISFGLQTYDPVQRDRFNIAATLEDIERVTRNARARKFDDINVDMMFDLPGQTVPALKEDIARLADAGYDSVDYYNLHYFAFPGPFKHALEAGEIPPKPSEPMHFALFEAVREGMNDLGYDYVGDQIYSRRKRLCRYFELLWGGGGGGEHAAETVAIGASARGYLDGFSYINEPNTATYLTEVEAGRVPIQKVSAPLGVRENRGAFFMVKFFTLEKSRERAIASVPEVVWQRWIDWGLVEDAGDRFNLTRRGELWTPNMMLDAMEPEQLDIAYASLGTLERKPGARTGSF